MLLSIATPLLLFGFAILRNKSHLLKLCAYSVYLGSGCIFYGLHHPNPHENYLILISGLIVPLLIQGFYSDKIKIKKASVLILLILIVFISCKRNKKLPGIDYATDMFEGNQLYEKVPDSSFQYTFAANSSRYLLKKNINERKKAVIYYPMPDSIIITANTKELYQNQCAMCHGEKGDGKGYLYTEGKYSYPPGNLLQEKVQQLNESEIYHVISIGFNLMHGQSNQLSTAERWEIAKYIKSLPVAKAIIDP